MYSLKEVSKIIGVEEKDLRYLVQRFNIFLSPSKSRGSKRFKDTDIEIFRIITELKDKNKSYEEIESILKSSNRGYQEDLVEMVPRDNFNSFIIGIQKSLADTIQSQIQGVGNDLDERVETSINKGIENFISNVDKDFVIKKAIDNIETEEALDSFLKYLKTYWSFRHADKRTGVFNKIYNKLIKPKKRGSNK